MIRYNRGMCVIINNAAKIHIFNKKSKFFTLRMAGKLLLLQYPLLQLSLQMLHELIFSAFQIR